MCQDLIQLYSEIDALVERYKLQFHICASCNAECCRINTTDYKFVPSITPKQKYLIEDYLFGKQISPRTIDDSFPCMFLRDNRCIIYRYRLIDCRKYYCDRYDTEEYRLFHNDCIKLIEVYFSNNPSELNNQTPMMFYHDL